MTITYSESPDGIDVQDLTGFFAGWPNPPSAETHLRLLRKSDYVVLARDGEKVVGFITAISDEVLFAYIPLLEVLPEYRARGIGRELVRRMKDRLAHLYAVDLLCDIHLQPFYESLGMTPATGMAIRQYEKQSGV